MNILTIIPARGGSKGIPKKNIRLIAGNPLISYSIKTVLESDINCDLIVSTDDDEIGRIAEIYGSEVIMRPSFLAGDDITLDPVIYHAVVEKEKRAEKIYDIVITIQPTSPLLKKETFVEAINNFVNNNTDTLISATNNPHLSWTEKDGGFVPNYIERLNRQFLPKNLVETGSFVITKRKFVTKNSRFGNNINIFELQKNESIDIDTAQDWWVAEKELNKKNILIRVEGNHTIGLGHIYRGLLLANNLINHNIKFILSENSIIGIDKIKKSHYPYEIIKSDLELTKIITDFKCDIFINDILDTSVAYVKELKENKIKVINFEDLGKGSKYADAVINDLYEKKHDLPNHFWGSDYYCIRDEFLIAKKQKFNEKVKEILVLFGGTDPSNLTERLIRVIKKININNIHFTVIVGLGYENYKNLERKYSLLKNVDIIQDVKVMSNYMKRADIAISSQGRTMLELASLSIPTILLAQNKRELHHEFGYLKNGFINLGLGSKINDKTLEETLLWLIKAPEIRKQMRLQMEQTNLKSGLKNVMKIILGN